MTPNDDPVRQALAHWNDPRVQAVYEILCSEEAPPNPEEHWEGWIARRIVAALSTLPQAAAAVPLSEERYLDALRRIYAAKSIHDARHIVVHTLGTEVMRACGITPPEGASE
jgi:hypothetical protein